MRPHAPLAAPNNPSATPCSPRGMSGPHDAGHYNSSSWETGFFVSQGGSWSTPYGHFFLSWYSGLLAQHAKRVLTQASDILNRTGRPRVFKSLKEVSGPWGNGGGPLVLAIWGGQQPRGFTRRLWGQRPRVPRAWEKGGGFLFPLDGAMEGRSRVQCCFLGFGIGSFSGTFLW